MHCTIQERNSIFLQFLDYYYSNALSDVKYQTLDPIAKSFSRFSEKLINNNPTNERTNKRTMKKVNEKKNILSLSPLNNNKMKNALIKILM